MKRTLQERDVAERLDQMCRCGIALQSAAMLREQDEGKVRPRLLRRDTGGELADVAAARRFFGHHRNVGAATDFAKQLRNVEADVGMQPGIAQDFLRHHGVAATRREDQDAFGTRAHGLPHAFFSRSNGSLPPT
jgi:hypothetical protein